MVRREEEERNKVGEVKEAGKREVIELSLTNG